MFEHERRHLLASPSWGPTSWTCPCVTLLSWGVAAARRVHGGSSHLITRMLWLCSF